MIPVREVKPGQFEKITGNPTLKSLDGTRKAPLKTILHKSWSDEERAEFGVYLVEPATIPDGKRPVGESRYERQVSAVVEVRDMEDVPKTAKRVPDTRTPEEKVTAFAAYLGLTLDELRGVIVGSAKQ